LRLAGAGAGPPGYDPLSGFSSSVPLFVPATRADGTPVWRVSPARLGRRETTGAVDPLREFRAEKPAGGYRIFVVGESTAAGLPYDPSDAFAGGLARALAAALPELPVEVVDAAVSGYGSRRELLAIREIAAYSPDLILFYGGHNETWERGRYGSLIRLPPTLFRVIERLVATRTFTLASRLARREPPRPEQAVERFLREDDQKSLELFAIWGERAAGRRSGGEDDAERWFRANLERMADAAEAAGARFAVATLGQDLVDWAPGASLHRPDLGPDASQRWTRLVESGRRASARGDCETALAEWRAALGLDARVAELHYRVAQCERRLGRIAAARTHFTLASDLDGVPLGAPSRFNQVLRELARQRRAIFIDAAAALEAAAPDGLVGQDLFVDFVHPNLRGHQVIAAAIVRALQASGVPRPASQWRTLPEPEPVAAILARRPDYRTRELELALATCLLARRDDCAIASAQQLVALDPQHAAARRALLHLRPERGL
jgi:lysophospholipase L1-like esterase